MFRKRGPATKASRSVGERTRELIFAKALELFRKRGFEPTTMRDIADAAGVATGAAYYYFEGKEAIVAVYYQQVQSLHAAKVREELTGMAGLRERLARAVHLKLEILKPDRKFLGALFRYTGEPGHPLSIFGKGTKTERKQSVEIFREALGGAELTEEWKELLAWGLWLAHLAMILFFVYDQSEGQRKSHNLVDQFADLVAGLVEWTNSALVRPFLKPFQGKMVEMLREAGWSEEA
jgi:AcrR family transcriptional regulator